jgi:hypothetical protein
MLHILALVTVLVLGLASAPPLLAQDNVTMRSFEELLSAQGGFCVPDALGGCLQFVPPLPNFLVFCHAGTRRCASIDYAGLAASQAAEDGLSFGTAITGTVTERVLGDGTALVHLILRTTNAFTWVVDGLDVSEDRLALGHRFDEVLAGAEPAFAESVLTVSFLNGRPGSPLPDLVELAVAPRADRRITTLALSAWTEGPLARGAGVRAGTLGFGQIALTGGAAFRGAPDVPVDRLDLDVWGGRASITPLVCCPSSTPPRRAWPPLLVGPGVDAYGE